ncbi:GH3 family domain-containing protein [Paraburkholderia bannensis]|uniref:GH3 family domain-containing protein n=1 Tax=Paraburkholderia bannensis TaxID=765414 RepID=UPI002AC36A56|nr:GH3 auxin-responsive promoter family protein [Paraburkholderia bannensis]
MTASTVDPVVTWRAFEQASRPDVERWMQQIEAPAATQTERLMTLIEANRDSVFGRRHGFSSIRTPEQYRERVPVQSAADFLPWLERASNDAQSVLTSQPPQFFERTSGSTARQKLIPYTPSFLRELQTAMIVWLADMIRVCPGIAQGRAYWSMSPSLQPGGITANGMRIGSASDLEYLCGCSAQALASTLIVPSFSDDLSGGTSRWRYETLRSLVADETLTLLSVWSPTFLASLLRPLFSPADAQSAHELAALETELPTARARALRRAVEAGHCGGLWPRLAAVSCWLDGPSRVYAQALHERFPGVQWLAKGLFATEGVVSIPYGTEPGCALAIGSHYLEFVRDDGRVCDVSGLSTGDEAQVVMTTGGGLYRYALGDRVRVTGKSGRTPRVSFLGRATSCSDLVGEKLDEAIVSEALQPVFARGASACIVPDRLADVPHYVLLLAGAQEDEAHALGSEVEGALRRVFHYGHARRLGQLGALRVGFVGTAPSALGERLQLAAESAGLRAGDVKASALVSQQTLAQTLLSMDGE